MKKLFFLATAALIASSSLFGLASVSAASTNLIPNPSVEDSTNSRPNSWQTTKSGTNTTTFTYKNTGHTSSHSLGLQMTKRSSGQAEWAFTPISVTPSTLYTFTDWYQSNVQSHLAVMVTNVAGTTSVLKSNNQTSSSAWKQSTISFTTPANAKTLTVYHYLNRVGQLTTDDFDLLGPAPLTAPTVSITAPASGATVGGTSVVINANASDNVGVTGVQFKLDGNNIGSEDTTAPYGINWNSTTSANGNHTLSAVARDAAGLSATATITINVQNLILPPPSQTANLVPNPSLETSTNGTSPDAWLAGNWGTNTATFSYLNTGHTGTHSLKTEVTKYTNGAANWYYADVPVTAGKTYKYENWYQSNVDSEVDAEVVMTDGSVQYFWLGAVLANTNWTKFTATFTVPSGAKSLAIYQILAKTGYIISDDYSLGEYTPLPFNRGLVSITFDDGWTNQYQNAFPMLKNYGLPATFYIISGALTDQPDYMTASQVKDLQGSGMEIGSHSVTHPDLTTLSQAQMTQEMSQSQATLQSAIGVPITDFAYPFGAYNANTIAVGKQYYRSQRSVNAGLNTKDNFDITQLKIYEVDSNISQGQVQGWVQAAIAQKAWLILVYHEIAVIPTDPSDALYNTQPTDLNAELGYIKSSGISVVTINQAINEILPQL